MVREPFLSEEVEPGVWQISGYHGGGLGTNAAVVVSEGKALVVDTLYRPSDARRMRRRIAEWGVEPVALVNTHWHADHTKGNCLYDCPIWAEASGPRFLKRSWPSWVGSPRSRKAGGLRLKLPDHLFRREQRLEFGGAIAQLLSIPGHTTDSVGVYLPESRVFIAGDAIMELPFVWFGDSLGTIRSLRRVQRLAPRLIIQGHGEPCRSARLARDIRYLQEVRRAAVRARASGESWRKFCERPLEVFLPKSVCNELPTGYRDLHKWNLVRAWRELRST
jgi:cyclase